MNLKIKSKLAFNKRLMFLFPYIFVAVLLVFLPILLIVVNSFSHIGDSNFDSFELIKDSKTWNKIGRSLFVGIISAILCLLIGFPYAYFVARSKNKILHIYAMSFILSPLIIFTIAKIYAVRGFFLTMVTNENDLNATWFIIFGLTYLNLPYMIMPLYSVLKDMPQNIIESSNDLGYGPFKTILKVVFPYSAKAILSGLGLIFLSSATNFVISDKLLPDGSQLQLIGTVINNYTNPSNQYEVSIGTTLVIVSSIIFIGTYALINYLPKLFGLRKRGSYE
ncbi:ABC transporter permease [Mycoplasmopsis primatum]|uniref:ABC transporter permease n=1 Tax=Mycoplasmopsis primatum TaxID=55604 RepID=UPI000495484C|nr:ABC transporter permease [Mycoplasmopsis primatum]